MTLPERLSWVDGPYVAFDLETTAPDPFEARIVTATIAVVGLPGVLRTWEWLVNPGVEIPAEAAAIHGVTTERARLEGLSARRAVAEVADRLDEVADKGWPLVIFNASYDLTVMRCEEERHRLIGAAVGPVLDPLVLDRALVRYRPGKRTLADCCVAWGVRQDDAHTSAGDALAAARLAWRMARAREEVGLRTLEELQAWQAEQHRIWAEDFERYLQRVGRLDASVSREWPVRQRAAVA